MKKRIIWIVLLSILLMLTSISIYGEIYDFKNEIKLENTLMRLFEVMETGTDLEELRKIRCVNWTREEIPEKLVKIFRCSNLRVGRTRFDTLFFYRKNELIGIKFTLGFGNFRDIFKVRYILSYKFGYLNYSRKTVRKYLKGRKKKMYILHKSFHADVILEVERIKGLSDTQKITLTIRSPDWDMQTYDL